MELVTAPWDHSALRDINVQFEHASPREILLWGQETFGDDLIMATGFGPSGIVLMDFVSKIQPQIPILYLDTDLLFPETHTLRRELEERLGLSFQRHATELSLKAQEATYGPKLWKSNPDQCCLMRKVRPLQEALKNKRAWITGIRRDHSKARAHIQVVEWDDPYGVVKLNPLAYWGNDEVWSYIQLNDLPYNILHDEGYPSIGCVPCTRSVPPGESMRAGRWRGREKLECGIHKPVGSKHSEAAE